LGDFNAGWEELEQYMSEVKGRHGVGQLSLSLLTVCVEHELTIMKTLF